MVFPHSSRTKIRNLHTQWVFMTVSTVYGYLLGHSHPVKVGTIAFPIGCGGQLRPTTLQYPSTWWETEPGLLSETVAPNQRDISLAHSALLHWGEWWLWHEWSLPEGKHARKVVKKWWLHHAIPILLLNINYTFYTTYHWIYLPFFILEMFYSY